MKKIFLFLASFFCLAVMSITACNTPKNPAERIGWDFMGAYYESMDLSAALNLSDGVAAEKIRQSEGFREGLSPDAAAHRPNVDFKMLDSQTSGEEATLIYEVSIRPEKSEPRKQKTRLKLRLKNGVWKVTQFSDF